MNNSAKKAPKEAKIIKQSPNIKKLKLHQRVKQSFYSKHPFFVPLFTAFTLLFGLGISFILFGGQTVKPSDYRIIKFHSQGKNQQIPTRASTVGDFIKNYNIKIDEGDVLEPSADTQITKDDFSINLYKAKLVTIVDEQGKKTITKTADTAPESIAKKAGYTLYPEDKVEVVNPVDTINNGVLGTQLKIDKALNVKLILYGVTYDIRTRADTVSDLAKDRSINYDANSILPAPSTKLSEGSTVFISEPGKKLISGEEPIPKGQDTVFDDNLEVGKTQVKNEGSDGRKATVYEVLPDGSKKYLQSIILTPAVNKVVAKGRKTVAIAPNISVSGDKASLMSAAGISSSDYSYVDYIVSRESGWRPGAGNASSGAYGLCQALPASKMATAGGDYLTNPVTQLRWCSGYASRAYGGWGGAYNFWLSHHWW